MLKQWPVAFIKQCCFCPVTKSCPTLCDLMDCRMLAIFCFMIWVLVTWMCLVWEHLLNSVQFSSVHFSCSVVSDSLRPHEPKHARPPCPLPTPRVCPNSCPLSQWCHPTISSSVVPFSSCSQSFPASGSFQISQVAKVLEFQLQHQSFQWTPRTDLL